MVWLSQKSEVPSYLEILFPVTARILTSETSFQMSLAKMPPQTPVYISEKYTRDT